MSIVLDAIIQARGAQIAALCRVTVTPLASQSGVAAWAEKLPLAVLVHRAGTVACYAPNGAEMTHEAVEALLPGVIGQFIAAAEGSAEGSAERSGR
jgi:hypothetical protein